MSGGGSRDGASISPERRAAVETASRTWINRLIDPSRRNNLLFFRHLQEGTLDLSASPSDAIAVLIGPSCAPVKLADLVKPNDMVTAAAKLQEIRKRAVVNEEERGLETLFLALGMASWPASDDGRPYAAPVLLMPITVEQTGVDRRRLTLTRAGELQPNLVLLHYLETQKVQVSAEQLVSLLEGDDQDEAFDLRPAFQFLTSAVNGIIPQFSIAPHYIVGNFSFQKMAMVRDLRELLEALVQHDIVAAMAKDVGAAAALRGAGAEVQLPEIDAVTPDQEFLVLDADSTQQRAVGHALIGRNGVISGPPGTGKSQTIANLICEFGARGKKVLFVAEKRAALEAVLKRLERKGLAHLCLDLHGAEVSRRQVLERVAAALEKVRDAERVDPSAVHPRFVERRAKLNEHVRRLHVTRKPSDLSIFQLQGHLLRLRDTTCSVRWRRGSLKELTPDRRRQVIALLEEASGFPGLFAGRDPGPWTHAVVNDPAEAQRAHDLATQIARSVGPVVDHARMAFQEVGLTEGATLAEVAERVSLVVDLHEFAKRLDLEVFSVPAGALATALAPAKSLFSRLWATMTDSGYRGALGQVRGLSRGPNRSPSDLLDDVLKAQEIRTRWLTVAVTDSAPRASNGDVGAVQSGVSTLAGAVGDLSRFFTGASGLTMTVERLREWTQALAADALSPFRMARIRQIKAELRMLGAGEFVDDLCSVDSPPEAWLTRFDFAWLKSCLDAAFAEEPALATFSGQSHQAVVEEFKRLDVERLQLAIARVVRSHAERVIAVRNAHPEQDAVVKREAAKKRRHLPLRRLVAEAPDVLTALHPCWMASPLSVSQLLPGDRQYFDAVIFDEASQVLPEDAVTSLLRGHQCVVAGDRRQLPPTTFFAAGTDDGAEDDSATAGFESLLDVVTSIVDQPWNLDWHYRSRDESLIAYSNRYVYGDRLVTFPGAGGEPVVQHVLVPHVKDASSEEGSGAEVKRVVDMVLGHARDRPGETLGVITMGIAHARRVEAAIERAVQEHPELEEFFDTKRYERFFVKNLERVQGDERDTIILSIGYCKDASGTLPYRFGPLLLEGGERRLNVAITRARSRMTVVSSFSHLDMDPARTKARGVELLRGFLEYASKGGTGLTRSEGTDVPLNDFEQDVCDALRGKGIEVLPQWGASKYRIDLVAQHPKRPGQFVLAIECDGASYHASAGARDRDRLRQQHLEALGWLFHRIWSTDWFLQRDGEIARAEQAFRRAVAMADGVDSSRQAAGVAATATASQSGSSMAAAPAAAPPPVVSRRASIDEYPPGDIDRVVRWVRGNANRTDDEIVADVVIHLGFARRGRKIEAAIRESIARVRRADDRAVIH